MIASLPMYDRPETIAANDRLWAGITLALRSEGIAAPDTLDREIGLWEAWLSPDLLLSQTCGLPYRTRLHGRVTLVATPDYGLPGVPPGHYDSRLVVRKDDPRRALADFAGATLAVSEYVSQSGWAAPMAEAAAAGIGFGAVVATGAHRLSALAVAEGRADIAAIDALTWSMILRWDACAAALDEIGQTRPTPGLPWITARREMAAPLARALEASLAGLDATDRATLGIAGVARIDAAAYLAVPNPPPRAAEAP